MNKKNLKDVKEALKFCVRGCSFDCKCYNNCKFYVTCKNLLLNKALTLIIDFESEIELISKKTATHILKSFAYCNDTNFYEQWLKLVKLYDIDLGEDE